MVATVDGRGGFLKLSFYLVTEWGLPLICGITACTKEIIKPSMYGIFTCIWLIFMVNDPCHVGQSLPIPSGFSRCILPTVIHKNQPNMDDMGFTLGLLPSKIGAANHHSRFFFSENRFC